MVNSCDTRIQPPDGLPMAQIAKYARRLRQCSCLRLAKQPTGLRSCRWLRRRSYHSAVLRLTMAVGPFDPAWSFLRIQSDAARLEPARLTGRWAVALAVTAWFTVRPNFDGPE